MEIILEVFRAIYTIQGGLHADSTVKVIEGGCHMDSVLAESHAAASKVTVGIQAAYRFDATHGCYYCP